jgi:hypothetical protein
MEVALSDARWLCRDDKIAIVVVGTVPAMWETSVVKASAHFGEI